MPHNHYIGRPPRTLVLCFDGTGNLYDSTNTNVVKLFSLLQKDKKDEQLVYYQAGIGTYSAPGIMASCQLWAAKVADEAVAWYLDEHVMGGYQFLMQNYMAGDRICLFGFSRGSYTARALAGMLYKVGLLPKDNKEQIGFAYKMYKSTGEKNCKLAAGFKETFSRTVQIEFMGCWDTVSSVGLFWSRHLPFTSNNTIVKRFRHALSLDEHRAKFQPNLWHRDSPSKAAARMDPEHGSHVSKNKDTEKGGHDQAGPQTDVLEVWFAGCHSDVGGGSTRSNAQHSLANISLRWMIREIAEAQCGIHLDEAALARSDIQMSVESNLVSRILHPTLTNTSNANGFMNSNEKRLSSDVKTGNGDATVVAVQSGDEAQEDALDAVKKPHDELKLQRAWWALEVIPFFVSWQDEKGCWHRAFKWHLGRPRTIPTASPNIHATVQQRMANQSLRYTPRATWSNKPAATWTT